VYAGEDRVFSPSATRDTPPAPPGRHR
jgi:hypothetical protein